LKEVKMVARNNQDRLGNSSVQDSDPALSTEEDKLSFATPTEFVELPSKGRYYPPDHPLHGQSSVEIRYMTAKDEDILTSESLIKKGLVIDRLVQSVLLDKSINVKDLLLGDKNAIIIAARVTGYGADYMVDISCQSCGTSNEKNYNLEEISLIKDLDSAGPGPLGVEITEHGTFLMELPATSALVELKLMTGRDEEKLSNLRKKRKKLKLEEANLTDNLKSIIVSVNNDDDRNVINEFVQNLPSIDAKHIRNTYQELVPRVELKTLFECDECNFVKEVNVPITVQFFWPE
jgi:hypothetical protein